MKYTFQIYFSHFSKSLVCVCMCYTDWNIRHHLSISTSMVKIFPFGKFQVEPWWESQFLGRLIKSPGSLRRIEGSGVLKEEKRTNPFFLHYFILVNITKYPAWELFSFLRTFSTNLKMYIMGVGLVDLSIVSSNPVILNVYCGSGSPKTFRTLRHSFDLL